MIIANDNNFNEVVNEDMSGNFSAKVLKIMGIEK